MKETANPEIKDKEKRKSRIEVKCRNHECGFSKTAENLDQARAIELEHHKQSESQPPPGSILRKKHFCSYFERYMGRGRKRERVGNALYSHGRRMEETMFGKTVVAPGWYKLTASD